MLGQQSVTEMAGEEDAGMIYLYATAFGNVDRSLIGAYLVLAAA